MIHAAYPLALKGDLQAARLVVLIHRELRDLLGLDAADRVNGQGDPEGLEFPEHVGIERVADQALRDHLLDEGEVLRAHGVGAAEVSDERVTPRPKLATEGRPLRRQRARTEHLYGFLKRVEAAFDVRPAPLTWRSYDLHARSSDPDNLRTAQKKARRGQGLRRVLGV